MKFVFALFFFLASFNLATAQNLKNLERVVLFGNDYVRLTEWCRLSSFQPHWIKKDKELQVTNRWWKLSLEVDSRKSQINGINVLLSLPIIAQKGTVFISAVDLQSTLHPILYKPAALPPGSIKTICLDPGHGGKDPGNMEKKNQEKKLTILLAQEIEKILKRLDFKVVMTRTKDQTVDLSDRTYIASRKGADLFISLHYNSANNTEVKGTEVYCLSPAGTSSSNDGGGRSGAGSFPGNLQNEKNMAFAYQMQKALLKGLPVEDRAVKRARFEVLREVRVPAILVEGGFMSNPSEARNINNHEYRKKMALAIVNGILAYKKMVEQ